MNTIIDCHVHASLQTDMTYLSDFLDKNNTQKANIIACSHSRVISLTPWALQLKKKSDRYYVFSAPDLSAYYLSSNNLGHYFAENAKELMAMGCDGIKLLEGKPQMRKAVPVPDFDLEVWDPFWACAEENRIPILWHVNDPENFWDREHAPIFAVQQGWLYDDSYVNNEDQYRQVITVLKRHPELKICFAHFFFMSAQLERLADILDAYPNVFIDLTPGIEMYENFSLKPEETKAFFEKYHDRICYGTDIGGRCVLMGEEKTFDEAENQRRPKIVQTFLESADDIIISSDGHYIIGRPDFTMRCLGLRDERLNEIFHGNFETFVSEKPSSLNVDSAVGYCGILKYRMKLMEKYSPSFIPDYQSIDIMIDHLINIL